MLNINDSPLHNQQGTRMQLPVCGMEQEIVEAVNTHDVVILCGKKGREGGRKKVFGRRVWSMKFSFVHFSSCALLYLPLFLRAHLPFLPPSLPLLIHPSSSHIRRNGQWQINPSPSVPLRVRLHLPFLPSSVFHSLLLPLLILTLPDRDHSAPASGSCRHSTARGTGDG